MIARPPGMSSSRIVRTVARSSSICSTTLVAMTVSSRYLAKRAPAPASGMDLHPQNANLQTLVGQRLEFKVSQYEKAGRDVVVTRRPMLEKEAHERRKKALEVLQEGSDMDGVVRTVVDIRLGLYARVWRFASVADLGRITTAALLGTIVAAGVAAFAGFVMGAGPWRTLPGSIWIAESAFSLAVLGGTRFAIRALSDWATIPLPTLAAQPVRTLLYGAGQTGVLMARSARRKPRRSTSTASPSASTRAAFRARAPTCRAAALPPRR